jgi:hypothetical protein
MEVSRHGNCPPSLRFCPSCPGKGSYTEEQNCFGVDLEWCVEMKCDSCQSSWCICTECEGTRKHLDNLRKVQKHGQRCHGTVTGKRKRNEATQKDGAGDRHEDEATQTQQRG